MGGSIQMSAHYLDTPWDRETGASSAIFCMSVSARPRANVIDSEFGSLPGEVAEWLKAHAWKAFRHELVGTIQLSNKSKDYAE